MAALKIYYISLPILASAGLLSILAQAGDEFGIPSALLEYPLVAIIVGCLVFIIRYWAQDRKEWLDFFKEQTDAQIKAQHEIRAAHGQLIIDLQDRHAKERDLMMRSLQESYNDSMARIMDTFVPYYGPTAIDKYLEQTGHYKREQEREKEIRQMWDQIKQKHDTRD